MKQAGVNERNNKQVDHMIAAKRAWSVFYEVEKPL